MVSEKILQLSLALVLCACNRSDSLDSEAAAKDPSMIQRDTARVVEIKLSTEGSVNSIIKSNMMVRESQENKPTKVYLYDGVEIRYLNKEHELLNIVNSKKGYYDEIDQYVTLEDSVVVRNIEEESLHTEYLTWADSTHEFYTDRQVIINTKRQQITGVGLWASEDFSTYTIKQIKGVIQVEDNTL